MENCLTKEIKRKISLKENNNEVDFVVFVRSVLYYYISYNQIFIFNFQNNFDDES